MTTKYIGINKLADLTGLSVDHLRRLALANELPHLMSGRRMLFDPEQVRATLANLAEAKSHTSKTGGAK